MPDIQQPDIVGNYLQSYYGAKQKQTEAADRQRTMQRQDVADQQQSQLFNQQLDAGQIDKALKLTTLKASLLGNIADGDVQGFEAAKMQFAQAAGVPPEQLSSITIKDLPRLREQGGQELAHLKVLAERAGIAAQNASTQHSLAATQALKDKPPGGSGGGAPQGYQWQRGQDGSLSLAPIKGGPADPNRIAPGEGMKVRASNSSLDALEQSLNDYITNLGKTTPGGRLFTRGPEVSKVQTGHTDLLMQMKNLYELGVLNGPDYMLMTKIVEDPTGLMQVARGTDGLKAQTDTVKSIIARSRNLNNARLGLPPAVPGVANVGSLGNELPAATGKPGWVRR